MRSRYIPAILVCLCLGCQQQNHVESAQNKASTAPRFNIGRMDGGPMTIYERNTKERTAVVPDTSLRRSIIVINDPQCPLQISSFGLRTQVPDRVLEEAVDARWVYLLDWSLMPKEAITFWEVHSVFYDAVNRFVWVETNNNGPRTGDSKELKSGVMHTTGRMSWWKTGETEKLGRWLTSVHSISPAPVCWT